MNDRQVNVTNPFEAPSVANKVSVNEVSADIPHTTTLRPSQLRREQKMFAASIALPFLGFMGAIAMAVSSGISRLDLALLGSFFLVTVLGIEVGYHRLFSHHSFVAAQPIRIFLAISGCMALQGPIVYWASNHRRHHAFSDQQNDPHSPHAHGTDKFVCLQDFWHAHIGWIFSPERTCPGRYGRDLLADPVIQIIDRFYLLWVGLGLLIPAVIGGLVGGGMGSLHGFLWGGLARIFLVQQGTYSINSCCHYFGTRPFETEEKSTNNLWLALPTLGGSLHNTHHAFPSTAVNGFRWWHLDIAGWFIRALAGLGLAWRVKIPTAQMIEAKQKKRPGTPTIQEVSHVK